VALLVATARQFTAHRPLTVAALLRPKVNYALKTNFGSIRRLNSAACRVKTR